MSMFGDQTERCVGFERDLVFLSNRGWDPLFHRFRSEERSHDRYENHPFREPRREDPPIDPKVKRETFPLRWFLTPIDAQWDVHLSKEPQKRVRSK